MAERNRIAEIHGRLLTLQADTMIETDVPGVIEDLFREAMSDVLETVSEIVLEREEKSKWLQVTAATLFSERADTRYHKERLVEVKDEKKALIDEIVVLEDTIRKLYSRLGEDKVWIKRR